MLAMLGKFEDRGGDRKTGLTRGHGRDPLAVPHRLGQILIEVLAQFGLIIPKIQLRRTVSHKHPDDPFGLRGMMQGRHHAKGLPITPRRQIPREDAGIHAGPERRRPEACGRPAKKVPSSHRQFVFKKWVHVFLSVTS